LESAQKSVEEQSNGLVVRRYVAEDVSGPKRMKVLLVGRNRVLKLLKIEGSIPVERLVPRKEQYAQAIRHLRWVAPIMPYEKGGCFVHGISPFVGPERKTATMELPGCRSLCHYVHPQFVAYLTVQSGRILSESDA
jgi:hypothetical protein